MALFGPERSLAWFAPLLLFYAMADGVLAIAAAARAAYKREQWAGFLLEGTAGVIGVVAVGLWPGLSPIASPFLSIIWKYLSTRMSHPGCSRRALPPFAWLFWLPTH